MEGDDDVYVADEQTLSLGAMVPEHSDWSFSFADHTAVRTTNIVSHLFNSVCSENLLMNVIFFCRDIHFYLGHCQQPRLSETAC